MRLAHILAALALSFALSPSAFASPSAKPVDVRIEVKGGYRPTPASVPEGVPLRLIFKRTESSGCSKEVVVPAVNVKKELPRDEEVVIEVPAQKAGKLEITCGMNMQKGAVTVEARR